MVTKKDIELLKDEIIDFAKRNNCGKDFSIFYNGKMFTYRITKTYRRYATTKDNINPLDYCEYFPEDFILGIAFDGTFYEMMHGDLSWSLYDRFHELFKKHNMYLEMMDSCHAAVYYEGEEEVEYTKLKKEKIEYIYWPENAPNAIFATIMKLWYELSKSYGDQGSCVIGEYLEFDLDDVKYRVSPQSPWQGSLSWESSLDIIKKNFEYIGAKNLYFNYGRMD